MSRATDYWKLVARAAVEESRGDVRPHIKMAVMTAIAAVIAAGVIGALTGKSASAGLLGAAGGFALALIAGLLLYFWNFGGAPAKLNAVQEAKYSALAAEVAAKAEIIDSDEVSRRVHQSIGELMQAYNELEIVSNRTNDDAWNILSQRLEAYKAAYVLLPPVARRFHEAPVQTLANIIHDRRFEHLGELLSEALDIMLHGECELDLTISRPSATVLVNRSSRRSRFVLLNVVIGNRENQTVSLYPVWHLYMDPGRVHAFYHADAEPLADWEEHRREEPRPANPSLAMPLVLQPRGAAAGYWCFFIGNDLENAKLLRNGRRFVKTALEIHDLASGRRTKSDRFDLELELIRSLLSPLPEDHPRGESPL
jgi:hypothetical protein